MAIDGNILLFMGIKIWIYSVHSPNSRPMRQITAIVLRSCLCMTVRRDNGPDLDTFSVGSGILQKDQAPSPSKLGTSVRIHPHPAKINNKQEFTAHFITGRAGGLEKTLIHPASLSGVARE